MDFELCSLADRANPETKDIAAISVERACRIMSGRDECAAKFQDRRIRLDRDVERDGNVRADQLGAGSLLFRVLAGTNFGAADVPVVDDIRSPPRTNRGGFHFVKHGASRDDLGDAGASAVRGLAMSDDAKTRFRAGAKVCSVAIIVLLVIAALGPAKWPPRTELGRRSAARLLTRDEARRPELLPQVLKSN
jgi:hypothetical protein